MKKKFFTLLIICPLLFIASCEKKVEGCTNTQATNYNDNADTDNGSCEYSINGNWDIVDVTYDGISGFNPLIEDYFTDGGWTFNDDGSSVTFIQDSSGLIEIDYWTWVLIGTNQLILSRQDEDGATIYTITQLNATNCVLSNDDAEFGNTTVFLSR